MLCATLLFASVAADETGLALAAMPQGYRLQTFDECGVPDLQPHVVGGDVHTFAAADVPADLRARTVAWDWRHLDLVYDGLDPVAGWVVAVTYANEPFNGRIQSLWAGSVRLHGPRPLPRGGVERLLYRVPAEAFEGDRLRLRCQLEGPVNVVVSAVELWAPLPAPEVLRLRVSAAPYVGFSGDVLDLGCNPVAGATVELSAGGRTLGTTSADAAGTFAFDPALLAGLAGDAQATVTARAAERVASRSMPIGDIWFEPLRYRPVPAAVAGLDQPVRGLDGRWRVSLSAPDEARRLPLTDAAWRPFRVPGQLRQQGYDLPREQPVAIATEFELPAGWSGSRVILRFDAVHGAARYWLNGTPVGRSDWLFCPVELDLTEAARPGQVNRLDLELLVDTPAERLSVASQYAFHNLGGVPRKVRLFALPAAHVRALQVRTGLDDAYRDGALDLVARLETDGADGLELVLRLTGAGLAEPVTRRLPAVAGEVRARLLVPNVRPWSAERPHRYDLAIELRRGAEVLERVERQVGFTRVEVRGRRLYLNGAPLKLAGACHHEIDPQSGRADTARHADQDARLLRGANLNFLRTAHYPPTEEVLEAADRLGLYVEVEAPFCWVAQAERIQHVREVLTPTSAMVDLCGGHPSVLLWSLANESAFNPVFGLAQRLVKELDPTRPTTFNHAFGLYEESRGVDLANLHYPGYPYDALLPDDPRPLLLGEYMFPVCHEQTDVSVNPGLRELWGHGHAEPDSPWGRRAAESYRQPAMRPGSPPGTWSAIVRSERVIGGAIWAAVDDSFWFTDGTHAGYSWHHGFWGLIDAWRRPKPEWYQARRIFSPVWFPVRALPLRRGQRDVSLPVENRYSFTDLAEVRFEWQVGPLSARPRLALPPGADGRLELPLPEDLAPGSRGLLRVLGRDGEPVTDLVLTLGEPAASPLPVPAAGPPEARGDGPTIELTGEGYRFRVNRESAALSESAGPLLRLPQLHLSRYDHGDLVPTAPPYALLPDEATRRIDSVALTPTAGGLEIVVRDRFAGFAGELRWRLDRRGVGTLDYDYGYDGPELDAREVGLKWLLKPDCETLRWRRWSEWGRSDDDDIARPEGTARARREATLPELPAWRRPTWPWALDQTGQGTNDFRGTKFCVYEASLSGPSGAVTVHANGDRHVRACLAPEGVWLHLITDCRMAPIVVRAGDRLTGSFVVTVTGPPT